MSEQGEGSGFHYRGPIVPKAAGINEDAWDAHRAEVAAFTQRGTSIREQIAEMSGATAIVGAEAAEGTVTVASIDSFEPTT